MVEITRLNRALVRVVREICIILLTLIRFLGVPLLILLVSPLYLWRRIVWWLSRIFRPDLAKMVVTRSSIMAVDNWMNQPRCNLIVMVGFEGELNLELLFAELREKVLTRTNENGEELHPELRQYYERWMGYIFWKFEENFSFGAHIRYYEQTEPITTEELTKIEGELALRAFEPKKSPWEVHYVRDYKPDFDENPSKKKSLVLFRLHHGIADGYSLLNLLLKEICQLHEHEYATPKFRTRSSLQKGLDCIKFVLKSQYEGSRQSIDCYDRNEWRVPKSKMSPTWFHERSRQIPIQMLKEIKEFYQASFTGVLIGGVSGGIRQFLIKRGKSVPEAMHCVAPFPVEGKRTTKLRNYYSFAYLKFPVGIEDLKKRIDVIENWLKALKRSTTPMLNFMQLPILGGLHTKFIKSFAKDQMSTILMSNFPGPFKQCSFMGLPVTELGFSGGLLRGNQGLGFAMLSYLGYLNIRAIGNQSIFPQQSDLKDLIGEIELEFYRMKDFASV